MLQQQDVWNISAGPTVGQRLDCLDVFSDHQTTNIYSVWREAVVVALKAEGVSVQEIKVHFEGFSSGYDKWIPWPRERNRFASLGTGGSRTPSDLADGPLDGTAAQSDSDTAGGSCSRRSSSISVDGSSGGAALLTRRRGFSAFKVYGAMKGLLGNQADGHGVDNSRTPPARGTPTVCPGPSDSPTTPLPLMVTTTAVTGEGSGGGREGTPPEPAAFAEGSVEHLEQEEEKECGQEQRGGREETGGQWDKEGCKQDEGAEDSLSPSVVPAARGTYTSPPPYPFIDAPDFGVAASEREGLYPPMLPPGESVSPAHQVAAAAATSTVVETPRRRREGGWRKRIKERSRMRKRQQGAAPGAGVHSQDGSLSLSPAARSVEGTAAAEAAAKSGGAEWGLAFGLAQEGKAVGGREEEGAAAAAVLMNETARMQPIRELTPHLVEELDGEGGGFTLSVFKFDKRDKVPALLVCGKYPTAYEADRAAEAFSSPVWHEPSADSRCAECQSLFRAVLQRRRHHCRNCGRLVCTSCASNTWPKSMLPHSYRIGSTELKVRVCRTCCSTAKSFRQALLQGSFQGAMEAYDTGCVNLRMPSSDNELPVHCAAAGGNVNLLIWLMEDRCCPIFSDQDKTVPLLDAKGRSVMAVASDSRQLEIMRYLSFTQASALSGMGMETLWRGLNECLREDKEDWLAPREGLPQPTSSSARGGGGKSFYPVGNAENDPAWRRGFDTAVSRFDETDLFSPSLSAAGGNVGGDSLQAALNMSVADAGYSVYKLPSGRKDGGGGNRGMKGKDVCILCFDRKVNCTLVPCGHHGCCMSCAEEKLELCPVCRVRITLKVKTIDA